MQSALHLTVRRPVGVDINHRVLKERAGPAPKRSTGYRQRQSKNLWGADHLRRFTTARKLTSGDESTMYPSAHPTTGGAKEASRCLRERRTEAELVSAVAEDERRGYPMTRGERSASSRPSTERRSGG
jgi:hypothetical protein